MVKMGFSRHVGDNLKNCTNTLIVFQPTQWSLMLLRGCHIPEFLDLNFLRAAKECAHILIV